MLGMAKKRKPTGRARQSGKTRLVTFEFPAALDEALERHARSDYRSKKAIVVLALQEYLARHAAWPPPEPLA